MPRRTYRAERSSILWGAITLLGAELGTTLSHTREGKNTGREEGSKEGRVERKTSGRKTGRKQGRKEMGDGGERVSPNLLRRERRFQRTSSNVVRVAGRELSPEAHLSRKH